jgi:hypothetical protein
LAVAAAVIPLHYYGTSSIFGMGRKSFSLKNDFSLVQIIESALRVRPGSFP